MNFFNNTIWKKYENCFTVCALISERESQKLYYIVLCICAKHLTVKSYMRSLMPLTVTLIIISFSSPTLSFIPDLKPSFSANPSQCSLTFSSSGLTAWFPRLLLLLQSISRRPIVSYRMFLFILQALLPEISWLSNNNNGDGGCGWQLPSTSTIAVVIITQPVGWYSFYRSTEGGGLSRPRQRSRGAQPVP